MSKFCTHCGAPRAGAAKFCTSCGAAFPSTESTSTPDPSVQRPQPVGAAEPARKRPHIAWVTAGALAAVAALVVGLMAIRGDDEADIGQAIGTEAAATGAVDVGVAEITAPDAAAVILDESGSPVPGDQVLVTLRAGAGRDVAERVASTVSGEVVGQIELIDLWQIRIPPTDLAGLDATIERLLADADVDSATINAGSTLQSEEIWGERLDPMRDPPYSGNHGDGFRMIGVETAWQYLRGSGLPRHGVKIGVTDNGLYRGSDPNLSEFPADRDDAIEIEFPDPNAGEIDAENVPKKYVDDVASGEGSHGTGVLTVLAGNPDDGGAHGVAGDLGDDLAVVYTNKFAPPYGTNWEVPPAPPVDGAAPTSSTTLPVEQIQWVDGSTWTIGSFKAIADQVRSGAKVINMSWGTDEPPRGREKTRRYRATAALYRSFFERMAERYPDVLFVAAAGNESTEIDGGTYWPGGLSLPNMITVGNLENDGSTVSHSNRASDNFEISLAAPGEKAVRGVGPDGTPIADGGGTSNAAPQVTGAAALLLSIKPDLTAAELKELLTSTARTSITRPDGTDQVIGAEVGGRVLAVDQAVFELVKRERLRLGLDEPNPDGSSPLTPEQLLGHGVVDAVAVSTEDGWNVRGIVAGCAPDCTSVSISVSEGSAVAGDTTQVLAAPGDAEWSVTFTELPGTITVRRTDNGAGSRIVIPETSTPSAVPERLAPFDGVWLGEKVLEETGDSILSEIEGRSAVEPISWLISTTPDGGGEVEIQTDIQPTGSVDWTGSTITITRQTTYAIVHELRYSGSLSEDGSTITGSWSAFGSPWGLEHDEPEFVEGGSFTVTRALGE